MTKQIIGRVGERKIYGKAWERNGQRRIYISVEGIDADYGYIEANGKYVPGKRDVERWFHAGCVDFKAAVKL